MISWDLISPSTSQAFYQPVYESLGIPPSNKGSIEKLPAEQKALKASKPIVKSIQKVQNLENKFWKIGNSLKKTSASENLNLQEILNDLNSLDKNVSSLPIPVQGRIVLLWQFFNKKIYPASKRIAARECHLGEPVKQRPSDKPSCCPIL